MNFNFDNIPAQPASSVGEPEMVSTIVALLAAAPRALVLKEVVAVLKDSGIEVPADTTVRAYLNRAAADGRITKPSRQSYAGVEGGPVEATEATENDADELDVDPLADL